VLKGVLVGINSDGFVYEADDISVVKVLGKSSATFDNSLGDDGDLYVEIEYGTFSWNNTVGAGAVSTGDVGETCFVADNQTVSMTGTVAAGVVVDVQKNQVRVWSGPFFGTRKDEEDGDGT
jgi:hypothetical protein